LCVRTHGKSDNLQECWTLNTEREKPNPTTILVYEWVYRDASDDYEVI